jgi:hypothetical protein
MFYDKKLLTSDKCDANINLTINIKYLTFVIERKQKPRKISNKLQGGKYNEIIKT